jgi:hypothetical protein
VHEPAQPSHLPHRDAAAAPVGGLATRQTLVDGHRQQRAASALLRVPDGPIAFAECSQHVNHPRLQPAFPVGAFFAQYRLGI